MRNAVGPHPLGAPLLLVVMFFGHLHAVSAGQLDSATYFALQRGMSESELLVRAGPPDLVTHPGGAVIVRRSGSALVSGSTDPRLALAGGVERIQAIEVKEYHYVPDHREHDPHLTVVTLRGGRVWEIERTKLLTRPKASTSAPAGEPRERVTDMHIRIQRADRVLTAAEAYAATRARLKDRAALDAQRLEAEDLPGRGLYTDTNSEGVPYFGDVPPVSD